MDVCNELPDVSGAVWAARYKHHDVLETWLINRGEQIGLILSRRFQGANSGELYAELKSDYDRYYLDAVIGDADALAARYKALR